MPDRAPPPASCDRAPPPGMPGPVAAKRLAATAATPALFDFPAAEP
jgi:hypothetical protein